MANFRSSDDAVTAAIGAIAILGVAAAGIGVVMIVGAPILDQVEESADTESMVGQFDALRFEARHLALDGTSVGVGLDPAQGAVRIESGSLFLITTIYEDADFEVPGSCQAPSDCSCDLSLSGWLDGDSSLSYSYTGSTTPANDDLCRTPHFDRFTEDPCTGQGANRVCTGPKGDCMEDRRMCVEIYRASTMESVGQPTTCDGPGNSRNECSRTFGATVPLATNEDWIVRFTNGYAPSLGGAPAVYAEVFLLHTDRLTWTHRGADVIYEAGSIFTRQDGATFLSSAPALSESAGDFVLRLPTWQGSLGSAFTGSAQTVHVEYDRGAFLADATATRLRLDFSGDLAQAWCNTFLNRNAVLGAEWYWEADTGATCSESASDGTHGLFYDPDGAGSGSFELSILQQVLHASVRP